APDVALNYDMQKRFYPFTRLSGPANILVMPGLQSASISAKLLRELGGESVMGPYMLGLEHPIQIAPMTASASDLVMLAVLAGGDAHARHQRVKARRIVHLDVEMESLEASIAMDQLKVDDVGVL